MNDNEQFAKMANESNEEAQEGTKFVGTVMVTLILIATVGITLGSSLGYF